MISREDIDNLFGLLAIFRPNDPHLKQQNLRSAWFLVLAPYEKDDVRQAVGDWFRQSKYWPEPSEIASLCPPLPEKGRKETQMGAMDPGWYGRHEQWKKLVALRREAGIPATIRDAQDAGMTDREWLDILAERGLAWT